MRKDEHLDGNPWCDLAAWASEMKRQRRETVASADVAPKCRLSDLSHYELATLNGGGTIVRKVGERFVATTGRCLRMRDGVVQTMISDGILYDADTEGCSL